MTLQTTLPVEPKPRYAGPVFLDRGFRPFFLGGAIYAALAVPLWLGMIGLGWSLPSTLDGRQWHLHEMLFGYTAAALSGFALTAIPNWTGRLPVSGLPLAALFSLWIAGRIATAFSAVAPVPASVIDAAFLVVLAGVAWREVVAGKNVRNMPICGMISVLAVANVCFHVLVLRQMDTAPVERLTLSIIAFLLVLVGGRIVPSFTRNWLIKRKIATLPAQFGILDKAAMAMAALALLTWILLPETLFGALVFAFAGALLAIRLARWRGWSTTQDPLVLVLHLGYAWLPTWFLLMALHGLRPGWVEASAAIHALTAGAVGTMTLAVMTRASLGHSGRPLNADRTTIACYVLVLAGAVARVLAPYAPNDYVAALDCAGLLWCAAFAVFAFGYAPMLLGLHQRPPQHPE